MVPRLNRDLFPAFTEDSEIEYSSDSDTHEYSPRSSPTPEQPMLRRDAVGAKVFFQNAPTTPDPAQRDPLAGATRIDSPSEVHHAPQSTADDHTPRPSLNAAQKLVPEGILPTYFDPSLLHSLPIDYIRALGRNRAAECLSCQYIAVHDTYFLYAQVRLGGYIGSAFNESISPRAVLRAWTPASGQTEPWWVELHHGPAQLRVVFRDTAVGRSMLMSKVIHNAAIARELTLWAQKFHPHPSALADADPALLLGRLAEDDSEYDDTEVLKEI